MSSTPPRPAGFYYDHFGYIRPRRYFDHEGRPLRSNTKDTSYAPIPSWSQRSNPTTLTKSPHLHPALGRKEQHSLRWWLLREKVKKVCAHAIQFAQLLEQLQKMVNMHSVGSQPTKSVEPPKSTISVEPPPPPPPPKDQPSASGNRQSSRATTVVREWLEHGRVLPGPGPEDIEDANGNGNGTASPPPPAEPPRCRDRGRKGSRSGSRSTSPPPPVWNSSSPPPRPDRPKTRKGEFKVEIHIQKVQRFVLW